MSWGGKFSKKPYLEQFYRIKRWHSRLNMIRTSNSPETEADNQIDFIYAFFTNCFIFEDWLKNSGVNSTKIYDYRDQHIELKICRDLCNNTKHLLLTKGITSMSTLTKSNELSNGVTIHKVYDDSNFNKPLENSNYYIVVDFNKYNVFDVADKCVSLWEDFLEKNSLL